MTTLWLAWREQLRRERLVDISIKIADYCELLERHYSDTE